MTDYVTKYAKKVVSGEILASLKNIQVCKRHLSFMENPPNGCHWDNHLSNKAIKFVEMLPDPKTNQPMPLMEFQKFIVGSLYGWRRGQYRMFTKAYISMARKQGKSLIVSGMSVNELLFGQYPKFNRQIYVASSTYKQAQTIFKMASQQVNLMRSKSKFIREKTDVRKTDIEDVLSSSVFAPLSNNPDAVDGKDPTVVILDELASMPDDEMYSRFKTGMTLQKNPLTLLVSTAGDNLNSQMYQEYKYIKRILNEEVRADIQDELEKGTSYHKILIKNFNLWQAQREDSLLDISDWEQVITPMPNINGKDVYIGVDLSRLDDLTSVGFIFPNDDKKVFLHSHSFIGLRTNLEQKSKRDKINYELAIERGEAETTQSDSGMIDYKQVIDFIVKFITTHDLNVQAVCYDPWNAQSFITTIESMALDWPLIEVGQSFKALSQSIKEFRMWVADERIQHNDNMLLTTSVNNAVLIRDGEDNVKINKKMNRQKIDPIISIITAFTEARMHEFQENWTEKYESEEFGF
ncbi:TPA: terminase [Staphylococcus aureus]|nr:terminase [Staphylococcus aureus]